jgi:uncharacterized protein YbjQ (UPF0145 family)
MSKLDGDDGKPFVYTREILGKEFMRLVGDAFGKKILEEQIKGDEVLQMMNAMFGGTIDELPEHIQEVHKAIKLLESQDE